MEGEEEEEDGTPVGDRVSPVGPGPGPVSTGGPRPRKSWSQSPRPTADPSPHRQLPEAQLVPKAFPLTSSGHPPPPRAP